MYFQILIYLCIAISAAVSSKITKIIGGTDANIIDYPYHAALRRISDNEQICGGAIISKWHILTTAHCVDSKRVNHENLMICLGVSEQSSLSGSSYLPQKINIHPKYTGIPDPMTDNIFDIAVIMLKEFITFNEYQKKIFLPTKNIKNGEIGILTGWGATSCPPHTLSDKLKKAWMTVLDKKKCESELQFLLHSDQFCAYQKPGVGVCKGDGGSPIVSNHRVIGLVYASRPYATGEPEIYIDVFKHLDFIERFVKLYY